MSKTLAMELTSQPKQQQPMDGEAESMQERIRMRAYELYEARGCVDGHHEDDWYRAEAELRDQRDIRRAA